MSTCTRQHAQCRDSTITLTKYLLASEGAPPPLPEGAPAQYLLLRGRPPGAHLLAPEGAPAQDLLLRGRPPGARLLAPEGAPRPPLFTPHRTLPLPRSPGEGTSPRIVRCPCHVALERGKSFQRDRPIRERRKNVEGGPRRTLPRTTDQLEREGKVLPTRSANQRAREESFPCNCT